MKKLIVVAGVLVLTILGALIAFHSWHRSCVASGQEALENQEFGKARMRLEQQESFAFLESDHWKLQYLLAMSYLNDPALDSAMVGKKALPMLEEIPRGSEFYPEAQVSLAKNWFWVLAMPIKAETFCLNALAQDPENTQAMELLFSIYCATNQPIPANKVFWEFFPELSEDEKVSRFQQWYCSQFTENSANAAIDQVLRVKDPRGDMYTVLSRLVLFKNSEPEHSEHFAALANWWLAEDETKTAIEVLAKGREISKQIANEQYLGSFSDAMLRQGELALAEATINSWPENERGLKYWRNLGVLRQNQAALSNGNNEILKEAVNAYNKACGFWSSSFDPNLYHRISYCQKELGNIEAAEEAAQRSADIRLWMEQRWVEVGKGMRDLSDPEGVDLLIQFYQAIECPEAVTFLQERKELLVKNDRSVDQ